MAGMRTILVPVKDPSRAKQRLARMLSAEERTRLAWAMLRDLAKAIGAMKEERKVAVVTSSPEVSLFARSRGWDVVSEGQQSSESQSIDWASRELQASGVEAVLRLPADIPLITAADLDELLAVPLSGRAALIVPSSDGTGTNALLRTPPDAFPSRFGPDSYRLHTQEADRTGTRLIAMANPRIAVDIDEPGDVRTFLARASSGFAFEFLHTLPVIHRFAHATA